MSIESIWATAQSFLNNFQNRSMINGGISLADLNELEALLGTKNSYKTNHNQKAMKICELGSWTGTSTALFGQLAKESGGKVWAIDTFEGAETDNLQECANAFDIEKILRNHLKAQEVQNYVTVLRGKTHDLHANFNNEFFDVIFIDADHRYESVKKDIELWYPKLKTGGIICGHDCDVLLKEGIKSLYAHFKDVNYAGLHLGVCRAVSEAFPDARKTDTGVVWFKVK